MNEQQLKDKYPAILELSEEEQKQLFIIMQGFQEAAQQTIKGADTLYKMCDTCAFRKGTEANNSLTTLVAVECILKEEAFFCHHRFGLNGKEKLCNGWINVMNNL